MGDEGEGAELGFRLPQLNYGTIFTDMVGQWKAVVRKMKNLA